MALQKWPFKKGISENVLIKAKNNRYFKSVVSVRSCQTRQGT